MYGDVKKSLPVVRAIRFAALILIAGIFSTPAFAQKHEIALTLGGTAGQDRTASDATKLSLGSGTSLQANYAYRIADARIASLSVGVHFLADGSRSLESANTALPKSVASLFVTPDVNLKLFPHS